MGNYRKIAAKWYRSRRWRNLRKSQLARHPHCQCPHHVDQGIKANVVDHIKPHRGDQRLFWDPSNLQSMTKQCHDKYKQSAERGGAGFLRGCDENGLPLSGEHEWNSNDKAAD